MAGPYRHQALIEAPLEDVWDVISDPRTHPDWWPEVVSVDAGAGEFAEGDEYVRHTKMLPFVDAVETVWVAERLEHLKEARFRCAASGAWAQFTLTPAQNDTYVELESGMEPTNLKWRIAQPFFNHQYKRWLLDVLDALPDAIKTRPGAKVGAAKD
jgi:uncharacterized protein YndB with AHSA1/START domain